MASINDWLQDEAVRHALALQGYTNNVVNRVLAVLNRADARLYVELAAALERMSPETFTVERLESLLASVRAMNTQVYAAATGTLLDDLRAFTQYEASYQAQVLTTAMPPVVQIASVDAMQVYAAAMARPFQGVLLREVLKDLDANRAKLVRQTVAQGFAENKTTPEIVRELRGTRAKGYADGLMQRPRREIEAVVRTSMGHMAGFVQDRTVDENQDLIKGLKWSATLDLRTSPPCRLRDGKLYAPVTHKPIGHTLPWGGGPGRFHWNCRSHQTVVTKSYKELGIDIPEVVVQGNTRASLDGQVPAEATYFDWLGRQSAKRQDEVLGVARADLYRKGNLPIERMYDSKGQFLSLDTLKERDAAAFSRAGL